MPPADGQKGHFIESMFEVGPSLPVYRAWRCTKRFGWCAAGARCCSQVVQLNGGAPVILGRMPAVAVKCDEAMKGPRPML